MDFKQLEVYKNVVDCGSFSEAAKKLYITQPTVSAHLRQLEEELNTPLIERTTKSVRITDEGRRFYEYACRLIDMRNETLLAFRQQNKNHIRLGASTIPTSYMLPDVLSAYKDRYPESSFEIWEGNSHKIIDRLLNGSLDLGIASTPLKKEFCACEAFYKDELIIAAPANAHFEALKEKGVSPVRLLSTEPVIMRESSPSSMKEADKIIHKMGLSSLDIKIAAKMNDLEAVKHSISAGMGISILPEIAVADMIQAGKVIPFSLGEFQTFRTFYLLYPKNQVQSSELKSFLRFLRKYGTNKE